MKENKKIFFVKILMFVNLKNNKKKILICKSKSILKKGGGCI